MKTSKIGLKMRRVAAFFLLVFFFFAIEGLSSQTYASIEKKRQAFKARISEIAERYIGMPVKRGGDPDVDGTTDVSHLFCSIYRHAARQAGLEFPAYMALDALLARSKEVNSCCLENGDLMVLTDGNSAMIYGVRGPGQYQLLYASEKRGAVTSFSSQHLIFDSYWMKNLKGFYRIQDDVLAEFSS